MIIDNYVQENIYLLERRFTRFILYSILYHNVILIYKILCITFLLHIILIL